MKKQIINLVIPVSIIFTINICYAEPSNTQGFFSKVQMGGIFFNEVEQYGNINARPKFSSVIAVGGGWYALDDFRADLSFEHYLKSVFKKKLHNNVPECRLMKLKQKVQLSTFMLNGNFDIADFGPVKLFLTSGIGIARHKTSYFYSGIFILSEAVNGIASINQKDITKPAYNFVNSVGVGLLFNISNQINAEINYSWKNFGNIKPLINEDNEEESKKMAYKSNNLSVGFRVNL